MSSDDEPLLKELAALRPRPPSASLQAAIENSIDCTGRMPSRRRLAIAFVGSVAASLAAVFLIRDKVDSGNRDRPAVIRTQRIVARQFDDETPTLQAYTRALSRSPEALDALLDRHSVQSSVSNQRPVAVLAFMRPGTDLKTWIGEP